MPEPTNSRGGLVEVQLLLRVAFAIDFLVVVVPERAIRGGGAKRATARCTPIVSELNFHREQLQVCQQTTRRVSRWLFVTSGRRQPMLGGTKPSMTWPSLTAGGMLGVNYNQRFFGSTHVYGVGGVIDRGSQDPEVQQFEPGCPGAGSLHDDVDLGQVLVGAEVLAQVEGLPLFGVRAFPSLVPTAVPVQETLHMICPSATLNTAARSPIARFRCP